MGAGAIDRKPINNQRYTDAVGKANWPVVRVVICDFEDLDSVLETIVVTYRMLTRHSMIVPDNFTDERRLVVDLSDKTPRGTPFRMWFYGGDTEIKITTVRQWVDRARKLSLIHI